MKRYGAALLGPGPELTLAVTLVAPAYFARIACHFALLAATMSRQVALFQIKVSKMLVPVSENWSYEEISTLAFFLFVLETCLVSLLRETTNSHMIAVDACLNLKLSMPWAINAAQHDNSTPI